MPQLSFIVFWRQEARSCEVRPTRSRRNRASLEWQALLLLCVFFAPLLSKAQLTTGLIEGTVHNTDARVTGSVTIHIEGGADFNVIVHSNSAGQFAVWLPYGRYMFSRSGSRQGSGVALV